MTDLFAHSANMQGQRHDLAAHLQAVADLAAQFAQPLGASGLARALGLWHDLGKAHPAFQDYLLRSEAGHSLRRGPDHKAAGAIFTQQRPLGLFALLVQGHHGGLNKPEDFRSWVSDPTRRQAALQALTIARRAGLADEGAPPPIPQAALSDPLAADLLMRLVFSALVDADYLDTEQHFAGGAIASRESSATLADLWRRFERDQASLTGARSDRVSRARHDIYEACLRAAELSPGLFRLTVPTGGGKTRSALAFALRHALRHGHERIIVAIPFISITEQTADVYRAIFEREDGPSVVLEHHSAVLREDDDDNWARLAAENWDAPIVVTTTVQLLESLFANKPARMRKLHNLAHSIIILDEVQSLPVDLLVPILDALRGLAEHYGTTIVLSTATQPAFEAIPAFRDLPAREIVPEPASHFANLKRVEYAWRTDPSLSWDDVADAVAGERQALLIMNTKKDALNALAALRLRRSENVLHLSTLLCGEHRRQALKQVRRRLAEGEPCCLVSTQVVEAGVDLDFPCVWRALAPLDAILQAAGRCNREGNLLSGRVVVFRPADGGMPPGAYRAGAQITGSLLAQGHLDLHTTTAPSLYFERLLRALDPDARRIQALRCRLEFPEVARLFRMIDDDTESVIVPYGSEKQRADVADLVERIRTRQSGGRQMMRALQPYVVSVRSRAAERYRAQGLISPLAPGLGQWLGRYDPIAGLADDLLPVDLVI